MRNLRIALALASLTFGCNGDGTEPPGPAPVATVTIEPDSLSVQLGATQQLTATARSATGAILTGRSIGWSTSDPARATVTTNGLVTATGAGRVEISATVEQKTGSAVFHVQAGPRDFAIVGAQFTQGVQAADGSIPIVLDGNPAVLNVLITASPTTAIPVRVVLRLFDRATGVLVRADTAVTRGSLDAASSGFTFPRAQFLVPASVLRPGLDWQVMRDVSGGMSDDSTANDVWPRTGRVQLATVDVPRLKLRFIPIVLTAHGNSTGAVSTAALPEYLRTALSVHPLGALDLGIGAPFSTSVSFGTPPSGGAADFWTQVLSDLDLARLAHPEDFDAHWYGVVRPPNGFTFTQFGGFGYIPVEGASAGARTRTALGVQVGWFNNPTQARDLVAHELGHNFGRLHAPCGGAGGPLDDSYPVAGGVLDEPGHDVRSWLNGDAISAITISTSTGDVMGYCFPVWASTYTYRGVLNFRSVITAPPVLARGPVLVVRGSIKADGQPTLDPALVIDARASLPQRPGRYRLEGFAEDGARLFTYSFDPTPLDHAPGVRHFALAIPVGDARTEDLHSLRVVAPAGEVQRVRAVTDVDLAALQAQVTAARVSGGLVEFACPRAEARAIAVQDATGGGLLGTADAASVAIQAASGTRVRVTCSDGVASTRFDAIVP